MKRLLQDKSGVAAVEFAMCLPFLVLLYLGGYQLSDAISAYRKVTLATRTVADLTSQYSSVTDSDLDSILNASAQVLAPYKITASKITVSQIKIDASSNATVAWSKGKNVSGLTKDSTFALPAAFMKANTFVIVANIDYTYTPLAGASLIGTIPMRDQIIMGPRASNEIKH
jgi:Flp pilus assembly protein TadG